MPLSPRPSRLRKLQHKLVTRYHLETVSLGSEPLRHLVIYPVGALVAPEPGEQALQEADEEPFEESSDDAGDALEEDEEEERGAEPDDEPPETWDPSLLPSPSGRGSG